MKRAISLSIAAAAALVALSLAACATTPADSVDIAAAQASGQTCKLVQSGDNAEGVPVCGTAEQWAEFDQRVEQLNAAAAAGVTCRWVPTAGRDMCMTEEQWVQFDRRIRGMAENQRGGSISGAGANFGVPMTSVLRADPGYRR